MVGDFWAGSWINRYLERQSPVSKRAFWWRSLLQTIFNFWQKWNAKDRMSLHLAWGFHFRKVTGWCWDIFLRPALRGMKKFFMLLSVIITIPDIAVLKGKLFLLFFSQGITVYWNTELSTDATNSALYRVNFQNSFNCKWRFKIQRHYIFAIYTQISTHHLRFLRELQKTYKPIALNLPYIKQTLTKGTIQKSNLSVCLFWMWLRLSMW